MDIEFINVYISKQKALIEDLQTRLLISDTHLHILKNTVQDLNLKLETANSTIEQLNKKVAKKPVPQDA